jgi:hypothetical protein
VTIRSWWKRKSGAAKVVTVLAALLTLQIGLCFSTSATVLPAYLAIFGPSRDSELGLGLIIWQGLLSFVTAALLLGALVMAAVGTHTPGPSREKDDSND